MYITTERANEITNTLIAANNDSSVKVTASDKDGDKVIEIKVAGINREDYFKILDLVSASLAKVKKNPGETTIVITIEKMTEAKKAEFIRKNTTGRGARICGDKKEEVIKTIQDSEFCLFRGENSLELATLLVNAKVA